MRKLLDFNILNCHVDTFDYPSPIVTHFSRERWGVQYCRARLLGYCHPAQYKSTYAPAPLSYSTILQPLLPIRIADMKHPLMNAQQI